jgi:hypothetical protein
MQRKSKARICEQPSINWDRGTWSWGYSGVIGLHVQDFFPFDTVLGSHTSEIWLIIVAFVLTTESVLVGYGFLFVFFDRSIETSDRSLTLDD